MIEEDEKCEMEIALKLTDAEAIALAQAEIDHEVDMIWKKMYKLYRFLIHKLVPVSSKEYNCMRWGEVIDYGKYICCPDPNSEQLKEIKRRVYRAYNKSPTKL